ncbi:MAG: gluconate 2-dehydrogenase subunit 3 family protein [Blastocatellia bacterium]
MKKMNREAGESGAPEMEAPGVTRREALRLAAGAVMAPPLLQAHPRAKRPPRFLTPAELALLDELSELILPADGHSPGARAARAAEFINRQLAETRDEAQKLQWREGLRLIDRISGEMTGRPFLRATPDQRIALLTRISRGEADPELPEEKFFAELKSRVAHAYYTSKIGIHDELEYMGNTYLREFAGEDVRGGK